MPHNEQEILGFPPFHSYTNTKRIESYFRRYYDAKVGGYICPSCDEVFRGSSGFKNLQADHIIPKSTGGLTVWENMDILCGMCNLKKGKVIEKQREKQKDTSEWH